MNTIVKTEKQQLKPYDPWGDFLNLENFFPSEFRRQSNNYPAVNICEADNSFEVDVVAPGFKKEDFKVNVEGDILTISAESRYGYPPGDNDLSNESKNKKDTNKATYENKQYSRREYSYNSFTRSFRLPDNTQDDSIKASYNDGVLKLYIPKSKQQVKASKEIVVN